VLKSLSTNELYISHFFSRSMWCNHFFGIFSSFEDMANLSWLTRFVA